jgi:hypothetical protein
MQLNSSQWTVCSAQFYLGAANSIFRKSHGFDFSHHESEELVTVEFDAGKLEEATEAEKSAHVQARS